MMPVPRHTKEPDHVRVHRELDPVGAAQRRIASGTIEQPDAGRRDANAAEAGDDRQQHAFQQQLANDPPPRCAQGDAHGNFARAIRRPRQQQVGDVGAGDQQDERDRAHQREEHDANRPAVLLLVERQDAGLDVLVGLGILLFDLSGYVDQLRLPVRSRDAGRQVSEGPEWARIALLLQQAGHLVERQPDVGVEGEPHPFRHHADDRRRVVVDAHRPADHAGILAVAIDPHGVTDQRHGLGAGFVVVRNEVATDHRPHAERAERVGRHERAVETLGRLALVADIRHRAAVGAERIERPGVLAPVAVIEVRHATFLVTHAIERVNRHRPIGIRDRQSANQHRVHEGEHRGVDADPKGERDRRHQREPFVFQQQAAGKSQIFPKTHGCS